MKIAEKIEALRGKESRAKFAAKIGINANTLRNYESGLSLPNSDVLSKICLISGVDPAWLLFDDEGSSTEQDAHDFSSQNAGDTKNVKPNDYLDIGSDDDIIALPPTSTIEDNRELLTKIENLKDEIGSLYRAEFMKYKRHADYIRINEAFAIPSDAKYNFYKLWPEPVGYVLLDYLKTRLKMIEVEGLDSWRKPIVMIPSDVELEKREEDVFRRFNLKPTSKDVASWFSNFFGKDAKLKRSRFCRWAFVVYAEDYIRRRFVSKASSIKK